MDLPNNFKTLISKTFYDKCVNIYNTTEEVGEELDVVRTKGDLIQSNLSCNIHQISNEIAKRDYGLDINASIMITCEDTIANMGDIVEYQDRDYIITGILKPDSHTKIFANLGE